MLNDACVNCYLTVLHLVLTHLFYQNNALWVQELVWTPSLIIFKNNWIENNFFRKLFNLRLQNETSTPHFQIEKNINTPFSSEKTLNPSTKSPHPQVINNCSFMIITLADLVCELCDRTIRVKKWWIDPTCSLCQVDNGILSKLGQTSLYRLRISLS